MLVSFTELWLSVCFPSQPTAFSRCGNADNRHLDLSTWIWTVHGRRGQFIACCPVYYVSTIEYWLIDLHANLFILVIICFYISRIRIVTWKYNLSFFGLKSTESRHQWSLRSFLWCKASSQTSSHDKCEPAVSPPLMLHHTSFGIWSSAFTNVTSECRRVPLTWTLSLSTNERKTSKLETCRVIRLQRWIQSSL